ncbi:hypothetical protein ACFIC9_004623, partial [Salmonella enterica]
YSLESHLAARKTEEGLSALQVLIDDEGKFVDLERSQLWYGEERCVISGGNVDGFKNYSICRFRSDFLVKI